MDEFSELQSAKMPPEVLLGRLWRLPGPPLGPAWPPTSPSWGPENTPRAALGELLNQSPTLLTPPDPPTADLGSMLDPQDGFWSFRGWILVPPEVDF